MGCKNDELAEKRLIELFSMVMKIISSQNYCFLLLNKWVNSDNP